MRNWLLLISIDIAVALAQPSAVVDDLEQRALAAINSISRTQNWNEVVKSRTSTRARIEQSLNLNRPLPIRPGMAFLYAPKPAATPAPAVILVRPHEDPAAGEFKRLPAAMAQMGIFVLDLDAQAHHSRLDLIAEGVLPQTLIQRDVKSALGYLKARPDIDPKRLAIVGQGLVTIIAAGINSDFAAAVVLDGAPDLRAVIKNLRSLTSDQLPDSCDLLPGILQYAATEELLSLIAPRPLLLIDAAEGPLEYATEVYRSSGRGEKLSHVFESGWTAAARFATCAWLARWLQDRRDGNELHEPDVLPDPVPLELAAPPLEEAPNIRPPVSEQTLTSLLGARLPEGPMTFKLNCNGNQFVDFYPQTGIKAPVTVLRPGPEACSPERGTLIAIDDRGRASLIDDEVVQEAIRRGWVVWMLDPRCIGELKTKSDPFVFSVSLLLGENLAWRQAADILRLLPHAGGAKSRYPTALYARGKAMSIAASYVAAIANRNDLQWTVLRDAPSTFRELTEIAPSAVPFDILRSFDISDIWKAAKGDLLVGDAARGVLDRDW